MMLGLASCGGTSTSNSPPRARGSASDNQYCCPADNEPLRRQARQQRNRPSQRDSIQLTSPPSAQPSGGYSVVVKANALQSQQPLMAAMTGTLSGRPAPGGIRPANLDRAPLTTRCTFGLQIPKMGGLLVRASTPPTMVETRGTNSILVALSRTWSLVSTGSMRSCSLARIRRLVTTFLRIRCPSLQLWSSPITSDAWSKVSVPEQFSVGDVAVHGNDVYLQVTQGGKRRNYRASHLDRSRATLQRIAGVWNRLWLFFVAGGWERYLGVLPYRIAGP